MSSAYSMPPCPYHLWPFKLLTEEHLPSQTFFPQWYTLTFPQLNFCLMISKKGETKCHVPMSISNKGVGGHPRPGCLGSVMLRNKHMEWPEWATPQGRERNSEGQGSTGLSPCHRQLTPSTNKDKSRKRIWCHPQYHT